MMFFVGIGLGFDIKSLIRPWKKYKAKILLIPLATIAGTILFSGAVSIVLPHTDLRETIAIGSGFGYYSLSAIFLDKLAGSDIGMMALISNLARELLALLTIPFLARFCGKLSSYFGSRRNIIRHHSPRHRFFCWRRLCHRIGISRDHRRFFCSGYYIYAILAIKYIPEIFSFRDIYIY